MGTIHPHNTVSCSTTAPSFPPTSLLSIFDIRATAESAKPSAMEENPPTTDKVITTTITQDEKHTTATDGSDGETSTARSNLVAAPIWQNMKKRTRTSAIKATSFLFK